MDGYMDGLVDEWMDGRMRVDGWEDVSIDVWTDYLSIDLFICVFFKNRVVSLGPRSLLCMGALRHMQIHKIQEILNIQNGNLKTV